MSSGRVRPWIAPTGDQDDRQSTGRPQLSGATGSGRAIDLSELGGLALNASLSAAEAISSADAAALTVDTKATTRDLVTELDRSIERSIVEVIRSRRPADAILGEEHGEQAAGGRVRWIIDPLDGTTNFLHGRPDYAVAVAAEVDGSPVVGAIVKPATGEWMACDETGLTAANIVAPGLAQTASLGEALVSVGVSIDEARRPVTLSTLVDLLPRIRDFRRAGSTSCDLLAVATGTLDGYIGIGTKKWDVAAGWALMRSVGGSVHQFDVAGGHVAYVLSTPAIAAPLVSVVAEHATRFAEQLDPAGPDITRSTSDPSGRPRLRSLGAPTVDADPELGL